MGLSDICSHRGTMDVTSNTAFCELESHGGHTCSKKTLGYGG